ncbi:MAG TPA: DUF6677 family protein [Phycisphaerae bacterium]|nr:DUF6677 family protein [Phycisphaerae bacterium]
MSPQGTQYRSPVMALVLGWVIPGAGHAYAGRWGKAVLFAVLIIGLLVAGFALGGGTNIQPNEWWFGAQLGAGGPLLALTPISQYLMVHGEPDYADPVREMGTLYTAIAGLLNLLVMMDAYVKLAYPSIEGPGKGRDASRAIPERAREGA